MRVFLDGNVFSDLKSAAIFINNYKNIEEG